MRNVPDDREAPERSITGAAFWALMDRWGVADEVALHLIDGPAPKRPATRPRFRLLGPQVDTYEKLRGIDRQLEDLFGTSRAWLTTALRDKPFTRRTPLAFMAEGGVDAIGQTVRYLELLAFKASLERE